MDYTMASLIPVVFGALLLMLALRLLFRQSMLGTLLRILLGLVLLAASALFILGGLDLVTYRHMLKEQPVATLKFERLAPQTYRVLMVDSQGQLSSYHLKGDQWQLDARLIKWHNGLATLGFGTLYRLERLSGRYTSIRQETTNLHSAHRVSSSPYDIDTWLWLNQAPWLKDWVDAQYGSATYMPMENGAVFEVTLGHTGLIARAANRDAEQVTGHWRQGF